MRLKVAAFVLLVVAAADASCAWGQGELRGVVVLARHGARSPIESETRSGVFNAQPWPKWPVEPGLLTPHGITALQRMGEYYRRQYNSVLKAGCAGVAVESTNVPRTIASAKVVMEVVAPGCNVMVNPDLTTDPPTLDKTKLTDAENGRMGDDPVWFTQTYARPLAAMHDVLTKCGGCKAVPDFRTMMIAAPPPAMQRGMMAPQGTTQPVAASSAGPKVVPRDPHKENAVALGADFAQNLLLQYIEGMPMQDVGWGRVDRAKLDELMEMNTRYHDFMLRTPLWSKAAAGPLAEKISSLLDSQAKGAGPSRFAYLSAHDANLGWLGGLLQLDWKVSDQTQNATPPGSAMIFELWHDAKTNADTVRVKFVAQTLDEIRNLTPLATTALDPNAGMRAGAEPPSISPAYVPGCSGAGPEYACSLSDFVRVVGERVR
jgi:4-phytase/acid phosphatase